MSDSEAPSVPGVDPKQQWINRTWLLWRSDAGRPYATRIVPPTEEQLLVGYARTIGGDTPREFERLLLEQPDAPREDRT
jgi:hypothetical protein